MKRIVIVYNPGSGTALTRSKLRAKCHAHGIEVTDWITLRDGFEKKLKPYARRGQIVAAIGGDGTLSAVAGVLAGTQATFAPLSGGTLNHFTKDLGVAQDIDEALERLKTAKAKQIDVASVNNAVFINNSSIGLYPTSLHIREHFEDKLGKWPAAVIGCIRAFRQYQAYEVTIDGKAIATPFIFVGNNKYHLEDPTAGGRTRLDQGVLSIYTVDAGSRWQLLKLFGWALIGQLSHVPEVKAWTAQEVTIRSKRKMLRVSRDGELERLTTPLAYRVKPGALRVIGSS